MAEKKDKDESGEGSPFDVSQEAQDLLMTHSQADGGVVPPPAGVERAEGQAPLAGLDSAAGDGSAGTGSRADANMEVVTGVPAWTPEPGKFGTVVDPNGNNPHEIPLEVFVAQEQARAAAMERAKQLGLLRNDNGNKPLEKPKDAETIRTHAMLKDYPLVKVTLAQNPPDQPPLEDARVVINGYGYQIQRGVTVEVPEPVRQALVQAGLVYPENEIEASMFPQMSPQVAQRLQVSLGRASA